MTVLASGVTHARSLDAADISQSLREIDITTLVGLVRYDDKGDLTDQRVYIFQVRDGEFVQVADVAQPRGDVAEPRRPAPEGG
jgi:ABC-type branched-subunit amino acid transport system substrate-binding protein